MSKKHYVRVAALLKSRRAEAPEVVDSIAREMATLFAEDNPLFSHTKFLSAVGTI